MMKPPIFSSDFGSTFVTSLLLSIVILTYFLITRRYLNSKSDLRKVLPSPFRLPILGHLYLMRNGNPFEIFTHLSKKYGDIYSLQLGTVKTVVVSSMPLIKKVLTEQGDDFGDRPNFIRYDVLFGNDRGNSLAFCDYSRVQKTRRSLARKFCHTGLNFSRISAAVDRAECQFLGGLQTSLELYGDAAVDLKGNVQKACASIFFEFFCSEVVLDWGEDEEFNETVRQFDEIFWEINQSHATDVLPALAVFFRGHLGELAGMGKSIRSFVVRRIIEPHMERLDKDNLEDFVDILLAHLEEESGEENKLTMDQVLYELEDFLGGHSAVANLIGRAIVEIAGVEGLSNEIYKQHYELHNKDYITAVIYETLRKTSSPIVPHVASADTLLDGYLIEKGTMVMINNFQLNVSEELWSSPDRFIPERFLTDQGKFKRPSHFIPFSNGKRACMGYQLVEKVTADIVLAIVKGYEVRGMGNPNVLPQSCVAIHPEEELRVRLVPRWS